MKPKSSLYWNRCFRSALPYCQVIAKVSILIRCWLTIPRHDEASGWKWDVINQWGTNSRHTTHMFRELFLPCKINKLRSLFIVSSYECKTVIRMNVIIQCLVQPTGSIYFLISIIIIHISQRLRIVNDLQTTTHCLFIFGILAKD